MAGAKTWEVIFPRATAAAAVTKSTMSHEWDHALAFPMQKWWAALEAALGLWTSEGQKQSNTKAGALPNLFVGSFVKAHGVSRCWGTAEITEHTLLLCSPKSHCRATRCPHILLGLHSWSGHGCSSHRETAYTDEKKVCRLRYLLLWTISLHSMHSS